MTRLSVAAHRASSDGLIPLTQGPISLRDLHARMRPVPGGSSRALVASMLRNAERRRWAVILCRFKNDPQPVLEQGIGDFFRSAFTPGTNGLVEYWIDASLGRVDIRGSQVFGWIEVDLARTDADVESGADRGTLTDAALAAARRDHIDVITGFHRQISVYVHNWSRDDVPAGLDWRDPVWGKYWIDGSAGPGGDGVARINLTPQHDGDVTAHEMGHILGLEHDRAPDLVTDYGDRCCIMSQNNSYLDPVWGRAFGPAVCLPHLLMKGWMYAGRVYEDTGAWMRQPDGISLPLAPVDRPCSRANLGLKLSLRPHLDWDYYVEFVPATGWNKGLGHPNLTPPYLFVRTIQDGRPTYLALLPVPTTPGVPATVLEPRGNTTFEVRLTDLPGPIIDVRATKL